VETDRKEEHTMDKNAVAAIALIVGVLVGFGVGWVAFAGTPTEQPSGLLAQIQARGYIIVGTSTPWLPFEYYNETSGQYEGFDIDLVNMIADYLNVTVHWSDMGFDALVGACKSGTVDMLAAAMFVTPERAEELAFSVPYIRTNEVVVVTGNSTLAIEDLEDLAGHSVGVQTGTVEDEELSALVKNGTNIDLHRYQKVDIMFQDLIAGTLDAVYVDEPVLVVYQKVYSLKNIFTVPAPPTALYCRYDSPDLLKAINTVILNAYSDGSLDALVEKWFG